ncbi:MAG: hypothetical protein HKN14_05025 [Marinicaulis sp.]|nr:hypothetical protein [Marinicaulis sp.]NNL89625.1 hypothetical protein [Marinicaulis sp.]
MTYLEIGPLVAALALVTFMAVTAAKPSRMIKSAWVFPAGLSAAFLAFSLWTVMKEGLLGFWPGHSETLWGNQVWFDLLLAIGIGYSFVAPRAKALGMNLYLWMVLILSSGCIGLLAMVSRYLFLKEKAAG